MPERYEIRGKVGRGGIGAVYRAFDTVMGREVAIKRLLPVEQTKLNDASDASLKNEAAALARLSHPNILTIYAFEEDKDGPYVVTELVDGENLKDTIERGALAVNDFEGIVEQTLEPLIAAHSENLLHRDIKPANIMLQWLSTGRFQIKVLDFGLAKYSQQPSLQTLDQTGSFLGSIDYIAPEQIDLKPLDARTDLYSLGCVFYYSLTQRPPFSAETPAVTMRNHLDHKVTPIGEVRADLPRPIADFIMRLIAREPDDRPIDATEALREFNDARNGISPIDALIPVADFATPDPVETATGPLTPGGKTLLTGSAPISTSRQHTAPRSPASAKHNAKPKPARSGSLKVPIILLVVAIILGVLILPKVVNKAPSTATNTGPPRQSSSSSNETKAAPKNKNKGKNKQKPRSSSTPPIPPQLSPSLSLPHAEKLKRKLPALSAANARNYRPPISEGLVGHYHAGALTFREDLETPAKPGDRVAAWGNLASSQDYHYLARIEDRIDQIPKLANTGKKGLPFLNKDHPVLHFTPNTGLRTRSNASTKLGFDQQQLSTFIVFRAEVGSGHIIRFDGNNKRWNFLSAMPQKNRYLLSQKNENGTGRTAATVEAPIQEWLILGALWDGEDKKQTLRIAHSDGTRQASTPIEASPVKFIGYLAGYPNKPDAPANTQRFDGMIAEILIYSRTLSDDEASRIEDHLIERYFKK